MLCRVVILVVYRFSFYSVSPFDSNMLFEHHSAILVFSCRHIGQTQQRIYTLFCISNSADEIYTTVSVVLGSVTKNAVQKARYRRKTVITNIIDYEKIILILWNNGSMEISEEMTCTEACQEESDLVTNFPSKQFQFTSYTHIERDVLLAGHLKPIPAH